VYRRDFGHGVSFVAVLEDDLGFEVGALPLCLACFCKRVCALRDTIDAML
jgi:hypothetical protein